MPSPDDGRSPAHARAEPMTDPTRPGVSPRGYVRISAAALEQVQHSNPWERCATMVGLAYGCSGVEP